MKNRMKIGIAVSAMVSALAVQSCGAGGGSDAADRLLEACMASTNIDRSMCECVANRAEEDLSGDALEFVIASLNEDEDRAEELRGELDMTELAQAGLFMTQAPAQCAGLAPGD